MRLNFSELSLSPERTETKTFKSKLGDLVLTLKSLDPPTQIVCAEKSVEMYDLYEGPKATLAPIELGGKKIMLSRGLVTACFLLTTMQVPQAGEAPYRFEEWVKFAAGDPETFQKVSVWSESLLDTSKTEDEPAGNDSTGSAGA